MIVRIARLITLLVLGITPLIVIPQVSYPFIFGKTLFITFFGIILWAIIKYCGLQKENRVHILSVMKNPFVYLPIGLLIVDSLLSLFGVDVLRSYLGNEERGVGILQLWLVMIVYISLWVFFPSREDKRIVLYTIVGSSVAVFVGALLRYADILLYGIDTGFRISGTIANAIFFAQIELLYVGFALLLAAQSNEKQWIRWSAGGIAIFHVVGIILSKTRGTFVALVALLIIMGAYAVWNHKEWRATVKKVFLGVVVVGVLFFITASTVLKDSSDLGRLSRFSLRDVTTQTRFLAWRAGLHAFYERPIAGWGNENFKFAFDKYYEPELLEFGYAETHFDRAHNIVVERMVNFGVIGVIAYLVYFFGIAVAVYTNKEISAKKKMIFLGMWGANHVHLLFAFDTALSIMLQAALLYSIAPEITTRLQVVRTKKIVLPAILGVVSGVAILYFVIYPYQSSNLLLKAFSLIDQGKLSHAIPYYELALRIPSPYFHAPREEYARTAAKILQSNNINGDESLEWLFNRGLQLTNELIEKNPQYSHYQEIKGNLYLTRIFEGEEYAEKALQQYDKALTLSPKRQAYFIAKAQVHNILRDFEAADAQYTKAYELAPNVPETILYKGIALLVLEKNEEAKALILETLRKGRYPSSFQHWQLLATALASWGETKQSAFYYLVGLRSNPDNDEVGLFFAASAYRAGLMRETYEGLEYVVKRNGPKKSEAEKLLPLLPASAQEIPYEFDDAETFFE